VSCVDPRPCIGFLRHCFLPPSETFVHAGLRALDAYRVRVLTLRREQAEKFPHDDVTVLGGDARAWASGLRYRATTTSRRAREWAASVALVHAHLGNAGVHALTLARQARVPLVVSFYGKDVTAAVSRTRYNPSYWHYVLGQARLFARADRLVVLSAHMADALAAQGAPRARLRVVPLGVDVARFACAREVRRVGAPLGVLMVGREVSKKGFDDGLRACARARARGAELRVSLLGTGGPLRGRLAALARELELPVAWLDPRTRVATAMAAHDVLLVPSRTAANGDQEGTPTVIYEGSAAGLAIVATRHAGIPEQVEHERTGVLVGERDVDALAAQLLELWRAPLLAHTLGTHGAARMAAHHDLRAYGQGLHEVYRELL